MLYFVFLSTDVKNMESYHGLIKHIQVFERVDSTNKKTKELLENHDLKEGTFVLTHDQYAGKGYSKNTWESEPGKNITGSLILKPFFLEPHRQFLLTKVLSLAIKESISYFTDQKQTVSIKWPNDIYVNDKKIAGILVENSILGNHILNSICGIGINVNQEVFNGEIPNPVSLKMITNTGIEVNDVIASVSMAAQKWYNLLKAGKTEIINDTYFLSLYRLNKPARYRKQYHEFTGILKGTDDYGRLLIENETGVTEAYDFKEISFMPDL